MLELEYSFTRLAVVALRRGGRPGRGGAAEVVLLAAPGLLFIASLLSYCLLCYHANEHFVL